MFFRSVFFKLLYALFLLMHASAFAQYNTVWWLNHNGFPPSVLPNIEFHFLPGVYPPQQILINNSDPPGIISNSISKNDTMLFYTNGVSVFNRNTQLMGNGDSLNYSTYLYYQPPYYTGTQSTCIVPKPGDDLSYYMFHLGIDTVLARYENNQFIGYFQTSFNLYLSEISFTGNPLGEVINKNKVIITDTLPSTSLTACKHANGRDWWIIIRKSWSPEFYTILVSPDTLIINLQSFAPVLSNSFHFFSHNNAQGAAIFSNDGSKLIIWEYNLKLTIFDFNRCEGTLSNPIVFYIPTIVSPPWIELGTSAATSTSGRFLYFSSQYALYQLDLWHPGIIPSLYSVAVIDSFYCLPVSVQTLGFISQNSGPDNRIYITSNDCAIHVIHNPDLPESQCNFIQHDIFLPGSPNRALARSPLHLNYSLGPVPGSVCDTLTGYHEQQLSMAGIRISPNPGNGLFRLMTDAPLLQHGNAECRVFDAMGGFILSQSIHSEVAYIDMTRHPDGMYFIKLISNKKQVVLKAIKHTD